MDGVTGCPVLSFITSQDREEHSTLVSDSPRNPGWQQDPSKSSLGSPQCGVDFKEVAPVEE